MKRYVSVFLKNQQKNNIKKFSYNKAIKIKEKPC